MRKLPVYLLLDTSGSMFGEPIEAVKNGVELLISTLRQDPYALETAWLSVITFANTAQQDMPLTELTAFQTPQLQATGRTTLGAALELLAEKAETEVGKTSYEQKGDWKPLVFIMTDGAPTDDITRGVEAIKKCSFGVVVACAAGKNVDTDSLKRITETVVQLDTANHGTIKAFFNWVSASVSAGSVKVDNGTDMGSDALPPPPDEVKLL